VASSASGDNKHDIGKEQTPLAIPAIHVNPLSSLGSKYRNLLLGLSESRIFFLI